jgi:hypothetical protein
MYLKIFIISSSILTFLHMQNRENDMNEIFPDTSARRRGIVDPYV